VSIQESTKSASCGWYHSSIVIILEPKIGFISLAQKYQIIDYKGH